MFEPVACLLDLYDCARMEKDKPSQEYDKDHNANKIYQGHSWYYFIYCAHLATQFENFEANDGAKQDLKETRELYP